MKRKPTVAACLAVLAATVGITPAAAAPTPATRNLNHIDRVGPPGTVPIGRTSATAVPITSPIKIVYPTVPIVPTARPYGGELYEIEADGSVNRARCTAGFNVESAHGIPYIYTAGHCTKIANPTTGRFFYPVGTTSLLGTHGSRFNYDTSGDRAIFLANRDNDPSQVLTPLGSLFALTAMGNPLVNEKVCIVGGNSRRTTCGTVTFINQQGVVYGDGSVHGNLAIVQFAGATSCPQPGDSGGPGLVVHDAVGITSGVASDPVRNICWTLIDQAGNTASQYGFFAA